ncbi:MAG: hypothetical protein CMJ87_03985 [Planctomycetes bacterium]|nr:hypothetical protein [Planctomycetota bacterium]
MRIHSLVLACFCLGACRGPADQPSAAFPIAPTEPALINDDGGWCWFQDERALGLGQQVIVGSVATGRYDSGRSGNVEATLWTPSTGEARRWVLAEGLGRDDHNAPAFLALEDGDLLAVYTRHGQDNKVRHRRLGGGLDEGSWSPEQAFSIDAGRARYGATYSNLYQLSATGIQLDFFRGVGWDPNVLRSVDGGRSWSWDGRLLGGPGRPYLRYASNGHDRVHFVATQQHPRDHDNGLFHGYLLGDQVHNSAGRPLAKVSADTPLTPAELTCVFPGGPSAVAWPADLELSGDGQPVCLFTVQVDGADQPRGSGGQDHRFYLARYGDNSWSTSEIAFAGTRLYAGEDDYTGLGAIDPHNTATLVISTDAHPLTGEPLVSSADGERHRELFWGEAGEDDADAWTWTAITENSSMDQLRPIIPPGEPRVLLWLRGTLRSYTDYDLEVVGLPLPR